VAAPDVGGLLADIDAGGIGEALSDVPNFIGDGCAPSASVSTRRSLRLSAAVAVCTRHRSRCSLALHSRCHSPLLPPVEYFTRQQRSLLH
jgi:hypothetical protein